VGLHRFDYSRLFIHIKLCYFILLFYKSFFLCGGLHGPDKNNSVVLRYCRELNLASR
jgi:hypothetical protein